MKFVVRTYDYAALIATRTLTSNDIEDEFNRWRQAIISSLSVGEDISYRVGRFKLSRIKRVE